MPQLDVSVETLSAIVAIVAALVSAAFAVIGHRSAQQSRRSEVQRQISALYDALVQLRIAHPEVLSLARRWTTTCWQAVYDAKTAEDAAWARYYAYAELCLGFCNSALYAEREGHLSRREFSAQYEALVRLVLTEHDRLMEDLLVESGYISSYIRDFRRQQEAAGWNWRARHEALDHAPGQPTSRVIAGTAPAHPR